MVFLSQFMQILYSHLFLEHPTEKKQCLKENLLLLVYSSCMCDVSGTKPCNEITEVIPLINALVIGFPEGGGTLG